MDQKIGYKAFPDFENWSHCTVENESYWNDSRKEFETLKSQVRDYDLFKSALEYVIRACSFQTGVIKNLYEDDRGITYSAAITIATWEAALKKKPSNVQDLVRSQLESYDLVLDFATKKSVEKITEFWIRSLHQKIVQSQETYKVYVESVKDWQEHRLPKGEYKKFENHVNLQDGTKHYYCPVLNLREEMARFCENINTTKFEKAHPIIQAAYAHYAFVCIHPFADGNGRVSRALASIYTYRSASVPILITAEKKKEYFQTLSEADQRKYQPFINFIFYRTIDAIKLVNESLKTAMAINATEAFANLQKLYITEVGYTPKDIEESCENLLKLFKKKIEEYFIATIGNNNKILKYSIERLEKGAITNNNQSGRVKVCLESYPPFKNEITEEFIVEAAENIKQDKVLKLVNNEKSYEFKVMIEEIYLISESLKIRMEMFVPRIASDLINRLTILITNSKKM